MNKLTIFFLIILSNLVTNVQAAEEVYQTPVEEAYQQIRAERRKKEMLERTKHVVAEYNRVSEIEEQTNKLIELRNLANAADDAEAFLIRNQMYGMKDLPRVRRIQKKIRKDIDRMRKSVMDVKVWFIEQRL